MTDPPRVLICDDEAAIRDSLAMVLEFEDYDLELAENGQQALDAMARRPADLVLQDIKMPGLDGMEVLEQLRARWPATAVIMISGHGDIQTAIDCIQGGAFDFIEKPLDKDRLLVTMSNALTRRTLQQHNVRLQEQVEDRFRILGDSPRVVQMRTMIERVAGTDARVLVLGENGTGKELVARAIHRHSRRAAGPFVDVNCAAIPGELIESELFGHRKGAFTGASEDRVGKFEQATGGTIFLDEIGDMSLPAQAKMLRVLEENKLERVGDTTTIEIDARVVAATNKDLEAAVALGAFRQDLLHRLNVVPITCPPLRDRTGDIPLLVPHLIVQACEKNGLPPKRIDPGGVAVLQNRDWPGNVRELRNVIERLAILSPGDVIGKADVELLAHGPPPRPENLFSRCTTYEEFKNLSEKLFLEEKLNANQWNVKKTAEDLQMQRSNLYKKIEKFGLKRS